MKLHIHWPKTLEWHGINAYLTCRCGAKRVRKGGRGYSPVTPGWTKRWSK